MNYSHISLGSLYAANVEFLAKVYNVLLEVDDLIMETWVDLEPEEVALHEFVLAQLRVHQAQLAELLSVACLEAAGKCTNLFHFFRLCDHV